MVSKASSKNSIRSPVPATRTHAWRPQTVNAFWFFYHECGRIATFVRSKALIFADNVIYNYMNKKNIASTLPSGA